jgi:hypothetical protein
MLRKQTEGGTLHNLSSSIFLQLIEMEQKTCTIRLENKPSGNRAFFFSCRENCSTPVSATPKE